MILGLVQPFAAERHRGHDFELRRLRQKAVDEQLNCLETRDWRGFFFNFLIRDLDGALGFLWEEC